LTVFTLKKEAIVPPERRFLHGDASQDMIFFIDNAENTTNLT
jgi:hypothetical protein